MEVKFPHLFFDFLTEAYEGGGRVPGKVRENGVHSLALDELAPQNHIIHVAHSCHFHLGLEIDP